MPLTNGSGSGFGFGSGSCYFRHWPPRSQPKTNFLHNFFCLLLFEGTFTSFFKDKKSKRVTQNSRHQDFSYYFCMMIEGFGSGRPKNMWIRWIRIPIRNTAWSWMNSLTLMWWRRALGSWYMAAARPRKRPSFPFESGSVKNWALQEKCLIINYKKMVQNFAVVSIIREGDGWLSW